MKSNLEILKTIITFIVIVLPVFDYIKKKKKSGTDKEQKGKNLKKYIEEFSDSMHETGQKKIIKKDLDLKNKKSESQNLKNNEKKDNNSGSYNFKDTTDNLVEEIKKERKELREKEITRAKENEFKPSFEISIEDELDSYDLANAIILKEILDKPAALKRDD